MRARFDGTCAPGGADAIHFRSPATILSVLSLVMTVHSSVIVHSEKLLPGRAGLWWGLLGVAAFSFTVPLTRVPAGGLPPLFIGSGRAVVPAPPALAALLATRQARPTATQWAR